MNRTKKKCEKAPNPVIRANFLSKWTFWWIRKLFYKGFRHSLEETDIYENKPNLSSSYLTDELSVYWKQELKRTNPSVLRVLFSAYGTSFIPVGLLYSLLETVARIAQPLCLGGLVSYFVENQTDITKNEAYLFAAGIVASSLVPVLTFHPFIFHIFEVGTKMRLACAGLIYRKALRISKSALSSGLNGRVVNILSNDLGKFDVALCFFHDIWKGPSEAILLGYFMYREIGISAVIGVAFMLSFIPLQAWVAKKATYYRQRTVERSDLRVKLMNEIILGIQVIKMYAWEKSFAHLIDKVRQKEVKAIRGTAYIYAALRTTAMISTFSIFLSLVSFVYLGGEITAKRVFIVSSFFNELNDSMVHFWPTALTFCAEAYVSTKRVTDFLLANEGKQITPEKNNEKNKTNGEIYNNINSTAEVYKNKSFSRRQLNLNAKNKGIILEEVAAAWNNAEDNENITIIDVNITIRQGDLVAVVGPVGAGKSTLLNIILGELEANTGRIVVNGSLSYASQEPWLFEGTIKDNIVFIENYDEIRYKKVLSVCSLERDIQLLPHGDLTVVGERGVSLSGGQKARVSLARAVYKQADIYLLDDPLSAVDVHVGKHIFEMCVREFLKDKIRILVTHQLQYLKSVEHIILINSGEIKAQGSFNAMQDLKEFKSLANHSSESGDNDGKEKSPDHQKAHDTAQEFTEDINEDRIESQAVGAVKFEVYKSYFQVLDGCFTLVLIMFLFALVRVLLTGVDYFISRWVIWEESLNNISFVANGTLEETNDTVNQERENLIIFYSILLGVTFVLYILRTYGFFLMCLRISVKLHDILFRGITRATMYFFNTNSSGRILNRFSKDIHMVDTFLPQALIDSLSFFIDIFAVLIIVAVANFWLLIPATVVVVVFYLLRMVYINTSRSIKRLESISRSPIYSHTNQTFQGLSTIHALKAEAFLENEFHEYQNNNTAIWYLFLAANRAFALWLDIVCVIYIGAVTFSFLEMEESFHSGDVGLAILQCVSMVGMCQWGMRQTAELENQMTSVERILEYAECPSEPPLETIPKYQPPAEWPGKGEIEFKNLCFKYSDKSNYVLKDLNLVIKPQEKIGIVGRTGAGKSSIIQSLFRLGINEGVIEIDKIDISTLGLHTLRSKISIIPQDPVLFSGTLRYNLDPFEQSKDEELWRALEAVELKDYVSSLVGGLNSKMCDGGSNFSMGQRQLVCLARAILRKNKILIMDEATANVDPETDELIQKTIRTKFAECTVLTIAHRLQTIMDSDRIVVMDAGRVVEVGLPLELLQIPGSYFRNLVSQSDFGLLDILAQTSSKKDN